MLHFEYADGSIFFLNHVISFIIVLGYCFFLSHLFSKDKKDKILHSVISAGLVFVFLHVAAFLHVQWWIVPIAVLSIGIGKEIMDLLDVKKRLFDWFDIIADLSGIAVPTLVYVFSFLM